MEKLLPHARLSVHGYHIDALQIPINERIDAFSLISTQNDVTAIKTRFNPNPTSWSMMHIDYSKHIWSLPRAWATRCIGICAYDPMMEDETSALAHLMKPKESPFKNTTNMSLREHQKNAFREVTQILEQTTPTGIVELPTAWGKSCFGIFLAEHFYHAETNNQLYKTLIVVTNTAIGEEWKKTIQMFCGKDDPSLICSLDGKHKEHRKYPNAPFLIATVQTLVNLLGSEDPRDILGPFLFVIFDEAHHFGAEQFSKVNYVANGKYVIGLSATPNRQDGMEKTLEYHLGDIIYREDVSITPKKWSLQIHKLPFTPPVKKVWVASAKQMEETYQAKVKALSLCEARNRYIASVLNAIFRSNGNRRMVAFSLLKAPLPSIQKFLLEVNAELKISIYTGDQKKKGVRLEDVLQSQIILTTYSIFGEGISCSDLNGMVVITALAGKGKMEQPLGRALRKQHEDIDVLIIDFDDALLSGMIYNRIRQYKDRMGVENMKIEHWEPGMNSIPLRI